MAGSAPLQVTVRFDRLHDPVQRCYRLSRFISLAGTIYFDAELPFSADEQLAVRFTLPDDTLPDDVVVVGVASVNAAKGDQDGARHSATLGEIDPTVAAALRRYIYGM